jgi:hypothetical protein
LNFQCSIHTPLGTTYAGIGPGLCVLSSRQEDLAWRAQAPHALLIGFGHRAFLSEAWFFVVSFSQLNTFGAPFYKNDFSVVSTISKYMVGFGYYLPDVEGRYTRFFLK